MFDRIIGKYFVDSGKLQQSQLSQVYQIQESKRAKLGVIAVTEKLMTVAQAEEINALQATKDKHFGDLAIERGYLTQTQVGRLLSLQGNVFTTFTSAIVERGFMTLEELDNAINEFQREKGFTDEQMVLLKAGDLADIVPMYVDKADEEYIQLFTYGIKNFYRLVDTHIYIDKSYVVHSIQDECLGYQQFSGDIKATVAIIGKDDYMQYMAKKYTKEEFIETKEDALDAMCELINCINGLYATDKSNQGKRIDLEPPVFLSEFAEVSGDDIHIMPIHSGDSVLYLIVSINSDVNIK